MKYLFFISAISITLVCAHTQYSSNSDSKLTPLQLENIEALANNENGEQTYKICYYESQVQIGRTYYDCGTCKKIYDECPKGKYSKCFD